jgi:hypothetical protein
MGLRGARDFALADPVEIVQKIEQRAHEAEASKERGNKMQLTRKALNARWAWTSAAAFAALAVLVLLDTYLRAKTGYGAADLQGVPEAWGIRLIANHWADPADAALAGFGLGFDYLFMPLYGAALYFGAIEARERFASKPGARRRIMALLAMAPVAGALFDACENALQMVMLTHGPSQTLASLAAEATTAKFVGVAVGLALSLAAVAGLFVKKKEEGTEK